MTIDDLHLPELTHRQEQILSLIIRAYTYTPEPVSSKSLAEKPDLNVSPATVRNEMAVLEDLGYIAAPHTSAGRVPTENGYRYFVKHLIDQQDLSTIEQHSLTTKLQSSPLASEQWMRKAASILSRAVQTAALVTAPIAETHKFKHLELIGVQGRLVLMVLVLHGGSVQQHMLNLTEPIPQHRLGEVANHINALCSELTADEVRMKSVQLHILEREVAELVADLMERSDSKQTRMVFREGLSDVVGSFQNNSVGAQQAVRVLEERAFLNTILGELPSAANEVQVFIGGEGRWDELRHLTMVISRYGIPGQATGAVGVLGPIYLNYGKAISTVRFVSTLMTDVLVDMHQSDQAADTPPALPAE
jgi:heat-inducible transcriptional repressor